MRILAAISLLWLCTSVYSQFQLSSPGQKIALTVDVKNGIHYSVSLNGESLIKNADIDLLFNGVSLGSNLKLLRNTPTMVNDFVAPVVAFKESRINNYYNQLSLVFKNNMALEFRAFEDGIAYRFITSIKGDVEVNEVANIEFADNYKMWASPVNGYSCSFEVPYEEVKVADFKSDVNTYLPLLIEHTNGYKMLITEADITDYPHMFLSKGAGNKLNACFPPFPLETKYLNDRNSEVTKGASYIAKTNGTRSFPWRLTIITENDAQLIESNLVYLLSGGNKIASTEWIKPGRVSWEWWNDSNLYDVNFKAGLNTESYKYYIDFASKNKLEYVLLDEGWSVSTSDLTRPNPSLDLHEIIRYGKEKNVNILLWATWIAVNNQMFMLDSLRSWGVAGIKIDFMDRADQWMVNFYEKVAREASQRNLLVDFHGAFKPNGLHRVYPNVVSYESVHGMEQNKWGKTVTPTHNLELPFIRMVCGPMDYTPGAMRNYSMDDFSPSWARPGSQGTRCHQLALSVVFETGIQMLCDSPSNYEKEKESTDFLSSVPVTWDEIKVLEAKVGEYLLLARRHGDTWFIGGLNGDTEREFSVSLSFLQSGERNAFIMEDGINASRFAEDYKLTKKIITNKSSIKVKMVSGGGFAARIE
jgi:alpha-glucosidase